MAVRIACIGECMVEMRQQPGLPDNPASGGVFHMAFGGDTANTAVYLARLMAETAHRVDYVTALGDDPYSAQMADFLADEGVGTATIRRLSGRMPGLYFIRTDERGERSFYYYRSAAAARDMFSDAGGQELLQMLGGYDWLYLSGITLSILSEAQRADLADTLTACRAQGGRVAFDNNYRPAGWADATAARTVYEPILARTDLALMTLDDEQALYPGSDATDCIDRLRQIGVAEIVVKAGAAGCVVADRHHATPVATTAIDRPVDTTAAGDSFNAAYLAARIAGRPPMEAAQAGNRLAGTVIMHAGAIMAR